MSAVVMMMMIINELIVKLIMNEWRWNDYGIG